MRYKIWLIAAIGLVAALDAASAPFDTFDAGGRARGCAIDPENGVVYLAVYDRAEVWQVAPGGQEPLQKYAVDKGPLALALNADGTVLACVNHLAGSVSLLDPTQVQPRATAPCGRGPNDIACLPDGRFVVTNMFSDSLTLIDPSAPEQAVTMADIASVPDQVAALADSFVVSTQVPAALKIFDNDSGREAATIPVKEPVIGLAALEGNRLLVATASALSVFDAETQEAVLRREQPVEALGVGEGRVYAVSGQTVQVLDPALSPIETMALSGPVTGVYSRGGLVVGLSPQARQWHVAGSLPVAAPEAVPVVAASEETETEPPKQEARIVEAEPVKAKAAKAPKEQAPAPAKEEPAEAPRKTVAQAAPEAPKPAKSESRYRHMPAFSPEPKAPRPWRHRPDPASITGPSRESLTDAFGQRMAMSPAETFVAPDWTQPLRDVQSDHAVFQGSDYFWEGNVRLKLEDTAFAADKFRYNEETGEMNAEGNVVVLQEPNVLTADTFAYAVPPEDVLADTVLLMGGGDEQSMAKKRLTLGRISAQNIEMMQPNQRLSASRLDYDLMNESGELENATGQLGIYYFGADRVRILGPASADGEEIWITTCDHDPPHYKVKVKRATIREGKAVYGEGARLYVGRMATPLFWPRWGSRKGKATALAGFDFDSGHRADAGYYANFGQRFMVSPDVELGPRFYPTTREGIGLGIEGDYDFTKTPSSPLFLGSGSFRTLYTTKERGHVEFYHHHDMFEDTELRLRWEQWFDEDFIKDFYYEEYRDRTTPRTYANVTHTKPTYIATGTVRADTHDFVRETERLPEATFHLLERRLADNLYFSFDTIDGYNEREPMGFHAIRSVNVGRLTYDLNVDEGLNVTPFWEMEGSYYSAERGAHNWDFRYANTVGATVQTRLHKAYAGARGFSGFKHLIVPSMTYSYRPEPTMGVEETPRFDAYDVAHGRSRLETKLDNIVFGRDAVTEEVWQVARLSLYQGNDFWNEIRKAKDYEMELDLRPRPWWGWVMAAERHSVDDRFDVEDPFLLQTVFLRGYERLFGEPYNEDAIYLYDPQYGDYDRLLTYVYYDDAVLDGRFNGRLGYSYVETQNRTLSREILYGAGYQLGEKWGLAFEHRYDFELGELGQQKYELRRNLHCWEASVVFRDRQRGWDVGVELSIAAFPGTKIKF